MSNTENSTTNPILDAYDGLTRSRDILRFMIESHMRNRDLDPGAGWILEVVETGIVDALALLNKVKPG